MKKLFVPFVLAVIITACSPTIYKSTSIKERGVPETITVLPPVSYVEIIGAKEPYSRDSLSYELTMLYAQAIREIDFMPAIIELEELPYEGALQLMDELDGLLSVARNSNGKVPVYVPYPIRELIEEGGQQYGLLIVARGFSRTMGNLLGDAAIGLGIGIAAAVLTGGAVGVYSAPVKANTSFWAFVVDARSGELVYCSGRNTHGEPFDYKLGKKQISKLLKKYFYVKEGK